MSPDQRGNSLATCRRRAKVPSTPSMQSAAPSQANMIGHSLFTAAIKANNAQPAPQAVKICTAKAAAICAGPADPGGVSGSMSEAYMLN